MYSVFKDYEQRDALPIETYFREVRSACDGSSYKRCSCTAEDRQLDATTANLTHLLFCLPNRCRCAERGDWQTFQPFVRQTLIAFKIPYPW